MPSTTKQNKTKQSTANQNRTKQKAAATKKKEKVVMTISYLTGEGNSYS
jgi:hypothetical protein